MVQEKVRMNRRLLTYNLDQAYLPPLKLKDVLCRNHRVFL